jgi:hypothetical protein
MRGLLALRRRPGALENGQSSLAIFPSSRPGMRPETEAGLPVNSTQSSEPKFPTVNCNANLLSLHQVFIFIGTEQWYKRRHKSGAKAHIYQRF